MPFRFDEPVFLWLLLLAGPVVWLGLRSLALMERRRKWTAIIVRLAVLFVLILILSGFEMVRWHHDLTVVAVVDRSESMTRFAQPPKSSIEVDYEGGRPTVRAWIDAWLGESWQQRRPGDRLGLVTYDARATVESMSVGELELEGGTIRVPRSGTDTAAGIRAAMAWFPADTAKRIVLISDGNDTVSHASLAGPVASGDLLTAAQEAAAAGIAIDVLPINYRLANEVMVQSVTAPVDARQGRTVVVKVVLRATQPTPGVLRLLHDGVAMNLDASLGRADGRIELADWRTQLRGDEGAAKGDYLLVKRVSVSLSDSGANRFEATFDPDKGFDSTPLNNRAKAFTLVHGQGKILVLDGVGGLSGRMLPDALIERGMQAQVVSGKAMPATLEQLQRYDAIILQNVPAEMITTAQQKLLVQYVSDLGGGLVMIGGPDSFGAGGWTNTVIDDILPVTCELPKQMVLPSGALVLVIDRSGSMQQPVIGSRFDKQQIANEAAVLAILTLLPEDHVGVVAFSTRSQWVYPLQRFDDPKKVANLVRAIKTGGGTNIYDGLATAYHGMVQIEDRNVAIKHIVMLTDGRGEGGNYEALLADMAADGITLSTIGVGDDVDADLLEYLADVGGGVFHAIADPNDLPQVFIKEARQVRKSMIREVAFVPQVLPSGSPIMKGIRHVPQLRGLVLTGPRYDGRVFMPMIGPQGEPLFAHWQVGLGRVAAFTSDATNRWATAWLSWDGFSDFWARTMRAIGRPSASRQLDLRAAINGDTLRIRLDAAGQQAGSDAGVDAAIQRVQGSVLLPDGSSQAVSLEAVAPGVYEASIPATEQGNYIVSLFVQDGQGRRRYVFGGANRPAGAELRFFASHSAILKQVAAITGGRVLEPETLAAEALFARTAATLPSRSIRPVWRLLLGWLLVLFLLDVALRRVAWDFAATAAKVASLFKTRQGQSEATLAALKRKLGHDRQVASPRPAVQAAFQAADANSATSSPQPADVATMIEDEADPPESAATAAPPAPDQPARTTGRLLDAKRRARQRMDRE